jgi:mono/diheme cytochrome c family protein
MPTLGRIQARWADFIRCICAILAALGLTTLAAADNAKDVQAGKDLAIKACSPCHAINAKSTPERAPRPAGASFEEIAKGSKATPEALRVFLLSTHSSVSHPGAMPSPALTEDQIRLISAYVSSLRSAKY